MRKYVAEFIATFFLVFIGAGSIVADQYLKAVRFEDSFGVVGIALAHGLALAVGIAAVIRISGGHANPAVSFAAWVSRRLSGQDLLGYVVAQFAGGIVAAVLLIGVTPADAYEAVSVGVPALGSGVDVLDGMAIEVVLTFFLAFTIWGVAMDKHGPKALAPFAIGLVVTFDILAGGAFTGAAMNPARWLGPALASGSFTNAIVWIAGPLVGALLGSLVYENLFLTDQPPELALGEPPGDDEEDLFMDDDMFEAEQEEAAPAEAEHAEPRQAEPPPAPTPRTEPPRPSQPPRPSTPPPSSTPPRTEPPRPRDPYRPSEPQRPSTPQPPAEPTRPSEPQSPPPGRPWERPPEPPSPPPSSPPPSGGDH